MFDRLHMIDIYCRYLCLFYHVSYDRPFTADMFVRPFLHAWSTITADMIDMAFNHDVLYNKKNLHDDFQMVYYTKSESRDQWLPGLEQGKPI